jgi:hypothetical protein
MSDVRHVVVHVEIPAAVGIPHPHALTTNEMHGLVIEQSVSGTHEPAPAIEKLGSIRRHQ